MHLAHLRLRDFRNYSRLDADFGPGFHLLLGDNAQGKTNILEAAYLLATLRSFRGVGGAQMIRHGAKGYFVGASVLSAAAHEIKMYWSTAERKLSLDDQPVRRLTDYLGTLRAVVFCTEDLQLVKGTARTRRRFLDLLLAQTQANYLPLLQRYAHALRARNSLLKQRAPDPALLDSFSQELIALGKSKPGQIAFASSGNGTSIHLCGELFKKLAGVDMQHVPYRGSAPALNDVLPGRLDVMFDNITSSLPHIRNNALRGLAVTTQSRVAVAPEFPPISDTVAGFDVSSWFSLFVPVKTPKDLVLKINRNVIAALGHGPTKEKFEQLGSAIVASTPEQMAAHLKSEMDKWGPVIREAGIKVEG